MLQLTGSFDLVVRGNLTTLPRDPFFSRFAKTEKFNMEYFFQCVEDREEEYCIENKIYQEFHPAFDTGKRYQHRRECIRDNNCTEYCDKKNRPFFNRSKIHTGNLAFRLLNLQRMVKNG